MALIALASAACSNVQFVDRVEIDNPTAFTANVAVAGDSRDGWLGLTRVGGRSHTSVEEVIDQGPTWVFRFAYAGYEEELRISRSELVGRGWRVEVPQSFASALRDRGVVPPP